MKTRDNESLTIGILTYKPDRRVLMTIASAAAQSSYLSQIIISDNGENERTGVLAMKIDKRIKYTKNRPALSAIENFIQAYELADTRYFCWLADDDFISPALAKSLEIAVRKNPGFVAYSGLPNSHTVERGTMQSRRLMTQFSSESVYDRILDVFTHGAYNYPVYSVFDRQQISIEPIKRLASWPGDKHSLDYVMSICLAVCGKIHLVPQFLYFYDKSNWIDSYHAVQPAKSNSLNVAILYILGFLFSVQFNVDVRSIPIDRNKRRELELVLRMLFSKYLLRDLSRSTGRSLDLSLPLMENIILCSDFLDCESSSLGARSFNHRKFTQNAINDLTATDQEIKLLLMRPSSYYNDKAWQFWPNLRLKMKLVADTLKAALKNNLIISVRRQYKQ